MLDDSLILGTEARTGKFQGAAEKALSVSASKLFKEDPYRFYLTKIKREKEPENYAPSFGTACHAGIAAYLEGTGDQESRIEAGHRAFQKEAANVFPKILDPQDRYNLEDARNGADKQNVPVTFEDFLKQGGDLLGSAMGMFATGWDMFSPIHLQAAGGVRAEATLGDLAKERGMPTADIKIFDGNAMRWRTSPCAVIAGVGYHGYVDAVIETEDGSPMILDHKFVGHVIPYYKTRTGWQGYDPSYNPTMDIQLDIYSYATGITRSGFQFFTRHPQYVPDKGHLMPGWIPEPEWKSQARIGTQLPMAWAQIGDEVRYITVWRPDPSDHPSRPHAWTRPMIMPRTVKFVRNVAQDLTESLLLLDAGVDPSIAFPAGNPVDLAKKACPTCIFNDGVKCTTPRDASDAKEAYAKTLQQREAICQTNPLILERRALWAEGTLSLF